MDINNLPKPDIKPTKDPGIMKDQDREGIFSNSYQAPQTNASQGVANPNAQPNRGGIIEQMRNQLEQQSAKASQQKNSAKALNDRFKEKKKTANWVWIVVAFYVGAGIIGSVVDNVSDSTTENSNSDTTTTLTATPSNSSSGTSLYETPCFSVELPDSSYTYASQNESDCTLYFSEGYVTASINFKRFDDENTYNSLNNFVTTAYQSEYELTEIDGYETAVIPGLSDGTTEYLVWVNDLELNTDDGNQIATLEFVMNTANADEIEQKDRILNSIVIVGSQ